MIHGIKYSFRGIDYDRFEMAKKKYGGDNGALHVVKVEEDAAEVSLQMDGNWTPHWEK